MKDEISGVEVLLTYIIRIRRNRSVLPTGRTGQYRRQNFTYHVWFLSVFVEENNNLRSEHFRPTFGDTMSANKEFPTNTHLRKMRFYKWILRKCRISTKRLRKILI